MLICIMRRLRLAACIVLLLPALCSVGNGQSISGRRNLAIALNSAMGSLGALPVTVPINSFGPIRISNIYSGCDTVNNTNAADDEVQLIGHGTYFTLSVQKKAASTMTIASESHPVVCDLNGWLWYTWGVKIYENAIGIPAYGRIGEDCDDVGNPQQYYMGSIDPLTLTAYTSANDSILYHQVEWFGQADDGAAKPYNIVDNAGSPQLGVLSNDLFRFPIRNPIVYIGSYLPGTPGPKDTGIAKIAHAKIEFQNYHGADIDANGYPDGAARRVLTEISIEANTEEYDTDCSDAYDFGSGPEPDPGGAGVRLSLKWMNYSTGLVETENNFCSHDILLGTPNETNDSLWNYFHWTNHVSGMWGKFDIDSLGYLVFQLFGPPSSCTRMDTFRIMRLRSPDTPPEYCDVSLPINGMFCVDDMTGELIYRVPQTGTPTCSTGTVYKIPCLEFCEKISGYRTIDGVLASSAVKLNDDWSGENGSFLTPKELSTWPYENATNNAYETGAKGRWRPEATFAYRTSIMSGLGGTRRIYKDAGVYLNDSGTIYDAFRMFDWRDTSANQSTKWLQLGTTTIASPFGEPLEERNIMGIYSSARFAHANTVPALVAKNARYGSIDFESFEDGRRNDSTYAHSGRGSLRLPLNGSNSDPIFTVKSDAQNTVEGILVSAWVKRTYGGGAPENAVPIDVSITTDSSFRRVAKTGEWALYEAEIKDFGATYTSGTSVDIRLQNTIGSSYGDTVWVDDVKVQPLDAEAVCYAYDPATLRTVAQFDDRHFGVFYRYNGEGKLTHVQRETERGMKTVTETQYHLPKSEFRDGTAASFALLEGGGGTPSSMWAPSTSVGDGGKTTRQGTGATFDIFDIEIGPEGASTKLFGRENPSLPDIDSLQAPDFSGIALPSLPILPNIDSLDFPDLPRAEAIKVLEEIRDLDRRIEKAASDATAEGTEEVRAAAAKEADELRTIRRKLITGKLGITDEEYRALIDAAHKDDSEEQP